MYFIDRNGVKNLNNGLFIEMGTKEWGKYKEWCETNEPQWGEPYADEGVVRNSISQLEGNIIGGTFTGTEIKAQDIKVN